jgi:hypothetical protein
MKSFRLLAATLVSLTASTAIVAAADGKHEYSTGHVVQIDYSGQSVALDNGYVFVAERASDLDRLWFGESVLIRFVRNGNANIADLIQHDSAWLVDPPPDNSD